MTSPEERGDPHMVQEIRRLLTVGDRPALFEYIRAVPPDELSEARTWFTKGGQSLLRDDADWRTNVHTDHVLLPFRATVRDLVTVSINPPGKAAGLLLWRRLASSRSVEVMLIVDILVSKGEDWCRSFVAASINKNAKAGGETAAALIRHCLPIILHFNLPTNDLIAYPRLWALYYRELMRGRIHEVWDDETAAKYEYPSWGGLQFRIDPSGRSEVLPRMQKHLVELFDLDATAPEALMRCFGIPDALAPLKGAGVGAAVCEYIQRGTVSRAYILELAATALSRCDGSPNQRVLAEVLAALKLEPVEAGKIIPLLISTVATAPGFLSFMALELLLATTLTGGDLQDVSVAVFGRSEKKPQNRLVRHLKSLRAGAGYNKDILAACWEAAWESSDLGIRTLAESILGVSADAMAKEQTSGVSLWGTGTRLPEVPVYVAFDVDTEKPLPLWNRNGAYTLAEEQYLDRFLRSVYHAPHEVRDWYARRHSIRSGDLPRPLPRVSDHWAHPDPETVLTMWASGEHDRSAHRFLTARVQASRSGPFSWPDAFCRLNALAVIRVFRYSELTVQAGLVPYSLATPSRSDFRVELDRLVSMLQLFAREGWQYGETDFFQALLRLGPLDKRSASDIPELPVTPLGGSADPERLAGRILRDWVGGGGFAPSRENEALVLPISLERFPSIPRELITKDMWSDSRDWQWNHWPAASTVVPFWPDLGATWSRQRSFYDDLVSRRHGHMTGATAGGIGLQTQEWLLGKLVANNPEHREDAVDTMLELCRRRLLNAENLRTAVERRLNAGRLELGRLTRGLALVAYEGHLDTVWPAITTSVRVAADLHRLPAGTPELLATCTELWAAVPGEQRTAANVPEDFIGAVLRLAAAKTATKTSLEAKRLATHMGLDV
ncbi:hypothetical protein J7E83_13475 [Arthrobacter sp. ISL-48]|uniref:hypothetical protein n=1 Tax=Arthrobacter sp. ISL-48 TaxID=2819110 RepID=UPI001BE89144|nr:hypothetical protein [Arthrobacter sp. ISL-48]MBT2533114.1 hypothetical protein [Arthrobacter sp. ISL-48]